MNRKKLVARLQTFEKDRLLDIVKIMKQSIDMIDMLIIRGVMQEFKEEANQVGVTHIEAAARLMEASIDANVNNLVLQDHY